MNIQINENNFKNQAKILKKELKEMGFDLKHSNALELLSKIHGFSSYKDRCKISKEQNAKTVESIEAFYSLYGNSLAMQKNRFSGHYSKIPIKLYRFNDGNGETYNIFAQSKILALKSLDEFFEPSSGFGLEYIEELPMSLLDGTVIVNTPDGVIDGCACYNSTILWNEFSAISKDEQ